MRDRITHRKNGPVDSERMSFLDEVVIHNATIHIEQMDDRHYWIGVTRGADTWHFWIASRDGGAIDMWCNEAPSKTSSDQESAHA